MILTEWRLFMRYLLFAVVVGLLASLALPRGRSAEDGSWSTVKGQLIWDGGPIPERAAITVNADNDHCLAKGPLLSEDWVINKNNKGIKNAFVWLAPSDPAKPLAIHPDLKEIKVKEVSVDQPMCAFVPHVQAVREGQELIFKNSAPVAHNVRWTGNFKNAGGNIILPPKGSHTLKDLKAYRLPMQVNCDIHRWMKAYVAVFDHPYFAITDENGNFEIKNAPVGDCQLMVWHESVGWLGGAAGSKGEKITVMPGGTDRGILKLKP